MFTSDRSSGSEGRPALRGYRCACAPLSSGDPVYRPELARDPAVFALREALRGLHELFVTPWAPGRESEEQQDRHNVYEELGNRALFLARGEAARAAEILDRFALRAVALSRPDADAWRRCRYAAFWRPILDRCAHLTDADPGLTNGLTPSARMLHAAILLLADAPRCAARLDRGGAAARARMAAVRDQIQERARLVLLTVRHGGTAAPRQAAYQAIIVAHLLYRLGSPPPAQSSPGDWPALLPAAGCWEGFATPLPPPEILWAGLPAAVQAAAGAGPPQQRLIAARAWFYKGLRSLVYNGVNAGALTLEEATEVADKLYTVARWLLQGQRRLPTRLAGRGEQSLTGGGGAEDADDRRPWEPADPGPGPEDLVIAADARRWEVGTLLDLALSEDRIWAVLMRHLLLRRTGRPCPPADDRQAVAALRTEQPTLAHFTAEYDPLPVYAHLSSPAVRDRYPRLSRLADWLPSPTLQGRGEDAINDIIHRQCAAHAARVAAERHLGDSELPHLVEDLQSTARWLLGHARDLPRPQRQPRRPAARR